MTRLLVTLTFLAACLMIVLITGRLATIPGQNWYWVGIPA